MGCCKSAPDICLLTFGRIAGYLLGSMNYTPQDCDTGMFDTALNIPKVDCQAEAAEEMPGFSFQRYYAGRIGRTKSYYGR